MYPCATSTFLDHVSFRNILCFNCFVFYFLFLFSLSVACSLYCMIIKELAPIITETLRKYPNTGFLKRICTKAYEIPNSSLLIKEGTNVLIPTYSLHHDPQYFPEPEKFDPDRFNEENRSNIVQGAYIPFGDGPRKCIGKKYCCYSINYLV